ncbi:VWA domain-containing protein [Streptomyces sp. NPDC001530]|uniref:vWA domain-containing protein n=1 Tax=Streptomyces sp. NPDC001530 TaxID=3364582 RepID=UPI003699DB95
MKWTNIRRRSKRTLRGLRALHAARLCTALAAAVVLIGVAGTAHALPEDDTPSRKEIYDSLGMGEQAADYTILVDTSGSMAQEGRYDTVRSTLRPFLNSISKNDHVALFTFDTHAQLRYEGDAGNPGNTEHILAQLPPAPSPGAHTDIGAVLEAALNELDRDDVSSIASVVLLTDGKHDPPDGSAYPESTGPPWDTLRERAKKIGERTDLVGYALPLGSQASGADLLSSVVRPTTVLRPEGVDDLSAYLERAGERTQARKAALLLRHDIGRGVTASWSGRDRLAVTDGEARTTLTLSSTSRRVPLVVTGLDATLAHPSATVSGLPDRVSLKPGQSRTFPVTVHGHVDADPVPVRRTKHTDAELRVTGRVSSPWAEVLSPDVDLRIPTTVSSDSRVPLVATVGHAQTLPVGVAALVLVTLLGWLLWLRTNRPRLHGELVLWPALGGHASDRIPLSGRRMTLRPQGVGGRGRIHGHRRATDSGARVDLLIRYSPDGTPDRESNAVCTPGDQVVINGISFSYLPGQPGRSSVGGPR